MCVYIVLLLLVLAQLLASLVNIFIYLIALHKRFLLMFAFLFCL